ncbi:MAG: HAMP domain-containing methyl-accepting chemotaxis protein [Solibacillus sp.]|jgi:methyl-accepting chemotaxis protein|uniref:methyl-accepting chemotaxis protein n=1 Tax=unclassified Solibacillus TaxID=2637870 RepID=UPI0030F93C2B
MGFVKSKSVGTRIGITLLLIVFILCAFIISTFLSFRDIDKRVDDALNSKVEQVKIIDQIGLGVAMQGMYARSLLMTNNPENEDKYMYYQNHIVEKISELENHSKDKELKAIVTELKQQNENYSVIAGQMLQSYRQGNTDQAVAMVNNELDEANTAFFNLTNEVMNYLNERLEKTDREISIILLIARTVAIVVLLISIIISITSLLFMRKTVSKPLVQLTDAVNLIADGDLTGEDLNYKSKDEIEKLSTSINIMKHNLKDLVFKVKENSKQLNESAEQLSASTEELTATSEEVSDRASTTAQHSKNSVQSSLESAQAMEETAIGVQRIAEASQVLHSSAIDTSNSAKHGGDIIDQARSQMQFINESTKSLNELVVKLSKQSEEIESITKVITEITDQTNLLSLNAAIEAARAGEHGKGFAVVADEVSKLAQQSKMSANSIVELTMEIKQDTVNVERAVADSLISVTDGVKIIGEAGDSFYSITQAVEHMSTQIQEISATSEQLSASTQEVSAIVIDHSKSSANAAESTELIASSMKEQTATMEQINAVALSLTDNANELQLELQKFKVE